MLKTCHVGDVDAIDRFSHDYVKEIVSRFVSNGNEFMMYRPPEVVQTTGVRSLCFDVNLNNMSSIPTVRIFLYQRTPIFVLLPKDFFYEMDSKKSVVIKKGVMLEGALSKSDLGGGHGSIIKILAKDG